MANKLRKIFEAKRSSDRALALLARANKLSHTDLIDFDSGDYNHGIEEKLPHDKLIKPEGYGINQIKTINYSNFHPRYHGYIQNKLITKNWERPIEKIPLNKVTTTQHSVNHSVVGKKIIGYLEHEPPDLERVNDFYGPGDHHYVVREGNHKIQSARYKGETYINATISREWSKPKSSIIKSIKSLFIRK